MIVMVTDDTRIRRLESFLFTRSGLVSWVLLYALLWLAMGLTEWLTEREVHSLDSYRLILTYVFVFPSAGLSILGFIRQETNKIVLGYLISGNIFVQLLLNLRGLKHEPLLMFLLILFAYLIWADFPVEKSVRYYLGVIGVLTLTFMLNVLAFSSAFNRDPLLLFSAGLLIAAGCSCAASVIARARQIYRT